ncbi:MAG: DedA family protein [Gammaproteobacteria bacterium]|nr:DedA family protein [Gammaproteobacteria bacterium]
MNDLDLLGLFTSAFISATLFPGGSEALLAYLYSKSPDLYVSLLATATMGNTLGAMTNWVIGRIIAWRYPLRQWHSRHQKAMLRIQSYGSPLLLLSWLPIIGDPLCLAAGWLRIHWLKSLIFIAIGKVFRYWLVLELAKYSL